MSENKEHTFPTLEELKEAIGEENINSLFYGRVRGHLGDVTYYLASRKLENDEQFLVLPVLD